MPWIGGQEQNGCQGTLPRVVRDCWWLPWSRKIMVINSCHGINFLQIWLGLEEYSLQKHNWYIMMLGMIEGWGDHHCLKTDASLTKSTFIKTRTPESAPARGRGRRSNAHRGYEWLADAREKEGFDRFISTLSNLSMISDTSCQWVVFFVGFLKFFRIFSGHFGPVPVEIPEFFHSNP